MLQYVIHYTVYSYNALCEIIEIIKNTLGSLTIHYANVLEIKIFIYIYM